ncbi:methenyltetrahydrofolate synthase domain-containing protein [Phymastichus coffea]|uniref:methenyltetrahydrofolate synthase domain-containing protein n=1 Tax=Phymastichus coffea TaxID=108790 RepID=UPI00273CC691|nr:methenyltetrahydrofolate synthase domain-containing protein [Phymastichus coffea]
MSEENQAEVKTKQIFREKVWTHMAKEELTNSFRSLCNRIPYFKGATEASQRLSELDEFKNAKLLMISPDKPQESVIVSSLQREKEILIPRPRLLTGLFHKVKNANGLPEEEIKNTITRHNIKQLESPVDFNTIGLKVDMVVLGSVCVNKAGYRIGDGEGFADLEFAILSRMKAIDENTIVVTTVHDCQILDYLPNDIFEKHDVPVDIIITPTQTIVINPKTKKPSEIVWPIISKRRLAAIPALNDIKQSEEKEGKTVDLKEEDSDIESRNKEKIRIKKKIIKLRPRLSERRAVLQSDSTLKENDKNKDTRRKPFPRKRRLPKSKENDENAEEKLKDHQTNAKSKRHRQRFNGLRDRVDFSLRLSNIASSVRVRDLKSALLERGVKPSNIIWRGQRGFCYLHFGKLRKKSNEEIQPVQVDSIVANLQQLKIGQTAVSNENSFIIVEPAEPVTRIEVTDVSAV